MPMIILNICLLKQVYLGCRVKALNPKQDDILIKICEALLLQKLGLSERFLWKIMRTKKSQLGVKILKPSRILAILLLKLHLGCM